MSDQDGSGDHTADSERTDEPNSNNRQQGTSLSSFISTNKVDTALWSTRVLTVIFTLAFVFPFFGGNPYSLYQRALLSSAATSALRLHQRLPPFQFSRVFFSQMLLEDSCHYLFYAIMFVNSYPITMVLAPIFLFAILHATSFTNKLLNQMGPDSMAMIRRLVSKLEQQQQNILRFIACNEIFLMPTSIILIFLGRASLILPFFYHRFLSLRYTSRRNPYCRTLFYELRVTVEYFIQQPRCPAFVRNIAHKVIALVIRISPQQVPVTGAQ